MVYRGEMLYNTNREVLMLSFIKTLPANMQNREWFPVAQIALPEAFRRNPDEMRLIHQDWEDMVRINHKRGSKFSVLGTQTFPEVPPILTGLTALANSSSETSLLTGSKSQPVLSRPFFDLLTGRGVSFEGNGILSTTSTPTITFKFYLNTTQGIATLGGTTIGATAAITTASGVSNKLWGFKLDCAVSVPGDGSSNATLYSSGFVWSPAGFASPYMYAITPGAGDSATVTATLDGSQPQFFNMSGTWSAMSSSDTITLEQFKMTGWN